MRLYMMLAIIVHALWSISILQRRILLRDRIMLLHIRVHFSYSHVLVALRLGIVLHTDCENVESATEDS